MTKPRWCYGNDAWLFLYDLEQRIRGSHIPLSTPAEDARRLKVLHDARHIITEMEAEQKEEDAA